MNPRVLIAIACFVSLILGIIVWRKPSHDRIARITPGHPSINSLQNGLTPQDCLKWEQFGTGAVPVLVAALQTRPGPLAKAYSNTWSRMPAQMQAHLTPPVDNGKIRAAAGALLADPKIGTNIPLPILARALQDPYWPVRVNALACLYYGVLPASGKEKAEILPQIIAATGDSEMSVRMSAVVCLRFYKEEHDQVTPILAKALRDNYPAVRIRAAMAFHQLDPVAAEEAGALTVAFDCLHSNSPHGTSPLASQFLQKLGKLPTDENE